MKNQIKLLPVINNQGRRIIIRDSGEKFSDAMQRKNFDRNPFIIGNPDYYTGLFHVIIRFLIEKLKVQAEYIGSNRITMDDVYQISHLINKCLKKWKQTYAINFTVKDVENYKMTQPVFNLNMVKRLVSEHLQNYATGKIYVSKDVLIFIWKIIEKIIDTERTAHALKRNVNKNINSMLLAPPSKVLPKGGIGYREMINDPGFKERWKTYDSSFK